MKALDSDASGAVFEQRLLPKHSVRMSEASRGQGAPRDFFSFEVDGPLKIWCEEERSGMGKKKDEGRGERNPSGSYQGMSRGSPWRCVIEGLSTRTSWLFAHSTWCSSLHSSQPVFVPSPSLTPFNPFNLPPVDPFKTRSYWSLWQLCSQGPGAHMFVYKGVSCSLSFSHASVRGTKAKPQHLHHENLTCTSDRPQAAHYAVIHLHGDKVESMAFIWTPTHTHSLHHTWRHNGVWNNMFFSHLSWGLNGIFVLHSMIISDNFIRTFSFFPPLMNLHCIPVISVHRFPAPH